MTMGKETELNFWKRNFRGIKIFENHCCWSVAYIVLIHNGSKNRTQIEITCFLNHRAEHLLFHNLFNSSSDSWLLMKAYLKAYMGPFKKYVTGLPPIFDSPPPLSLFVTVCLDPPPPLVTTQIVTNFMLIFSRPLMQILDLIFDKMCLFSNQTLLFTWNLYQRSAQYQHKVCH